MSLFCRSIFAILLEDEKPVKKYTVQAPKQGEQIVQEKLDAARQSLKKLLDTGL